MAYVNITVSELVKLVERNSNYDRERIRMIRVVNQNQLELTISIGALFPDIKVVLNYNRYEKGRMYFNVLSSGGIKMLMGLIAEMGGKSQKGLMSIEGNNIVFDIDRALSNSLQGMKVKDVSMSGEQIYLTVSVS